MAYNPGISFFVPFHQLDPSRNDQCIYFTLRGTRCRWPCSDVRRAIALRNVIIARSSEDVSLVDLLEEYAMYNCCRMGNAQHRDRIADVGLLRPLAQRWQDEIWRQAAYQHHSRASVPALGERTIIPNTYTPPATPVPSYTTALHTPTASPPYHQRNARASFGTNATPSVPIASSSSYQYNSPRSLATTESAFSTFGSQPHYDLRPREANDSTDFTSARPMSFSQAPLSEFRPHIADPLPEDSLFYNLLMPLEKRDFETGSVYIYDRASSPGHVKIGWTASYVQARLDDWSRCGYVPNLLFTVGSLPHAQRVETLTHHELLKEWRRERMCKAPHCGKSHKEWFEISKERAAQVLGDWAAFMKEVKPYHSEGPLKDRWREIIKNMDRNREVITVKKLFEHHMAALAQETKLVKEPIDLGYAPKIEEELAFGYVPKVERLRAPKVALVRVGSLQIEQPTLPQETSLLESEALDIQTPPVESSLPKAEIQLKSDLPIKEEPLSKTEPLVQTKSLPRTEFLFTVKPPFKIEPLSKTGSPGKVESLPEAKPFSKAYSLFTKKSMFKTEPLPKTEPVHGSILAPQTRPVKNELLPQQIPLPLSPLLQSTIFAHDTFSSQEITPSLSTGTEETGAIHIIANSDPSISVAGTLSNPKINSMVSTSTPASFSAMTLPSAAPRKDIPRTDTHASTDTSTDTSAVTDSPPLNVSNPISKPNLSDSSVTSASIRPKAKPLSDLLALHETEMSEALLLLSADEQERGAETLTLVAQSQQNIKADGQKEVVEALALITQRQQNMTGEGHKEETETLTSITLCQQKTQGNGQENLVETPTLTTNPQQTIQDAKQADLKSPDPGDGKATVTETEIDTENDTDTEAEGWDADDTLVEVLGEEAPMVLEKVVVEMITGDYDEVSAGKAGGVKGGGVVVVEREVLGGGEGFAVCAGA